MKKMFATLFSIYLLALFSTSRLEAASCCNDWGPLSFEGEWLYLRPTNESLVTALETSGTPGASLVRTRENLEADPSFHSGWRVAASYLFCNCNDYITARWTQLRTHDSENFSIPVGATYVTPFFIATTPLSHESYSFRYHAFDAFYSHPVFSRCRLNVELLAGVQYAWFGIRKEITFPTTTFFVLEHSHAWGVGPEIGFNSSFCLLRCLSLNGRGFATLLASRPEYAFESSAFGIVDLAANRPVWRIVPGWELQFGLGYDGSLFCLNYHLEAGYEVIHYQNAIITNIDSFKSASLFGPYIGLELAY